jgi:hypothetical protein
MFFSNGRDIKANHIVAGIRRFERTFQGMGVVGIEEDWLAGLLAQGRDHGGNFADSDEIAFSLGSSNQYGHVQCARGSRHRLQRD